MQVEQVIKDSIKDVFKELYAVDLVEVGLEHPQNRFWGDYSTNVALVEAKKLGQSPVHAAKEIAAALQDKDIAFVQDISVAGPGFINFTLTKGFQLSQIFTALKEGDRYGACNVGGGKRVALEHSNVNPNKAVHIGHLRNAVIGQFLERVYEFIGYDVNVQYYCNDLGVQVSTSLLGIQKLGVDFDTSKYKKFDHYAWDVYSKISQMLESDPNLKKELDVLMAKLDSRDASVSKAQMDLAKRILKDNLLTFAALDIDYDLVVYESSIKDTHMWEKTFEMLKKNENVYLAKDGISQGCWLIKMSSKVGKSDSSVEEDKVIVRSNGIPTYTGKDIAYHMWKYGLLNTDFRYNSLTTSTQSKPLYETATTGYHSDLFTPSGVVMNVIDVKQTYAIDAVRKALDYLGYKEQSSNLIHVNYGFVYLSAKTARAMGYNVPDNTSQIEMSGRKGLGVKVDDFIEMVDRSLKGTFKDFPNCEEVRNSVIKFDILRYDTFQDVVFDIDEALNIKGFTGPYIEYTHARANSLLEKAGFILKVDDLDYLQRKIEILDINTSAQEVMRSLYRFPEVILKSAKQYAPNMLCTYLFELCQKFNTFYNDSPVLDAENAQVKEFRLILTAATKQVVKNGLYLLGLKAVDKM